MKSFLLVCLTALSCVFAPAAEREAKLTPKILYTQEITHVPPAWATGIVYDLRDVTWTNGSPQNVRKLFTETHPLSVVLLRSTSDPAWFAALADRSHRVILVSPIGTSPISDVSVAVTTDEVSAAIQAIETGVDLASLALPEIAKRRFDEAALVRRHSGKNDPASSLNGPVETNEAPVPPTPDLMLQRAVQILQGLEALGRS